VLIVKDAAPVICRSSWSDGARIIASFSFEVGGTAVLFRLSLNSREGGSVQFPTWVAFDSRRSEAAAGLLR